VNGRICLPLAIHLCVTAAQTQNDSGARSPAASESLPPHATRSPGTAVLLSLLVPGGGQFYTGNYWKVPLLAGAELGLGYMAWREHSLTIDALHQGDSAAYVLHRDRRSTWLFFTGAAVAFSMADAYVSSLMYGFDRQMRLSLGPDRLGVEVAFDP
jgi:hypothetical protein